MVEEDSSYLGEARGESDVSFCYRGEFKILRRRRQRKRQKSNRLNWQNNNSTRASRFFVHFFAVTARLRKTENALFHVLWRT